MNVINLPSRMIMGTLIRQICNTVFYKYSQDFPDSMIINIFLLDSSVKKYNHFEDVESWEEKTRYLLNMLDMDCKLQINHSISYYKSPEVKKAKENIIHNTNIPLQFKTFSVKKKNKICFWRYDKNNLSHIRKDIMIHEVYGKQHIYTQEEWCKLYEYLNFRFDVVELEYRTPIREVYYHLSTSDFCIGYGGMYHNLCTSLNVPFISLLNTKYYTEEHLKLSNPKEYHCNPTIQEITNDVYFSSLIDKAKDALGGRINVY